MHTSATKVYPMQTLLDVESTHMDNGAAVMSHTSNVKQTAHINLK